MPLFTVGVIGKPGKENEQRLPIHPAQLPLIPEELRDKLFFEEGYAEPFGMSDEQLAVMCGGVLSREQLFAQTEVIILPKCLPADVSEMREGQILWGWPHYTQGREITQVSIDRKITGIAWERMFAWKGDAQGTHTFEANNEMAGHCSVHHAFGLHGGGSSYGGPGRNAVVFSFGATGRGAVKALRGHNFTNITVLTGRPSHAVACKIEGVEYRQIRADDTGHFEVRNADGSWEPLINLLAESDVMVNCTLQDPLKPKMFVHDDEIDRLKQGSLIVDVSCDDGMAFPFAKPTSFGKPVFLVADDTVMYYAVDHSPSHFWRDATTVISEAVLAFLAIIMGGPDAWQSNDTVRRAIDIRDGVIVQPEILEFQKREAEYPHAVRG